jgi:hypothetical protein
MDQGSGLNLGQPFHPYIAVNSVVAKKLLICAGTNTDGACYTLQLDPITSTTTTALTSVSSVFFDFYVYGGKLNGAANSDIIIAASTTKFAATTTGIVSNEMAAMWAGAINLGALSVNPNDCGEIIVTTNQPDQVIFLVFIRNIVC